MVKRLSWCPWRLETGWWVEPVDGRLMKTSGLNWHSKGVVRTFEMRGRPPCETVDKMVIGAGFDEVTPLVDCIHARIALKGLILLDTGVDGA